jgi:hypothetical protein
MRIACEGIVMTEGIDTTGSTEDWAPVHQWHRAVNDKNLAAARAVASAGIVVGGPQGESVGVEAFVKWIGHAGIHLEPVSWHPVGDQAVVVEQDATWPSNPEADPAAGPVRVATLFQLDGEQVKVALRFDELHEALAASG